MSLDPANAEFDAYAADYDAALNKGLALSGEAKEYFAEGRAEWVKECLGPKAMHGRCLDFGCGVGAATPFLMKHLELQSLVGADVSDASLSLAAKQHGTERISFTQVADLAGMRAQFDLAYCNGVFHHIPLEERLNAAKAVFDSLKPGGHFAFWENNKWNPMVHFIMSRVPFDADALMLWPHEARALLRAAGFEIVRTDYLFVFPAALAPLRFMEPFLTKLPLGGQYQILCRRPA